MSLPLLFPCRPMLSPFLSLLFFLSFFFFLCRSKTRKMKREKEEKDKQKGREERDKENKTYLHNTPLSHTQRRGMNERKETWAAHILVGPPFASCLLLFSLSSQLSFLAHTPERVTPAFLQTGPSFVCEREQEEGSRVAFHADFGQREVPQEKEKEETLRTLFLEKKKESLQTNPFHKTRLAPFFPLLCAFSPPFFPSHERNQPTVCPRDCVSLCRL
mmetsp:Transcript_16082/g.26316  ORF Transcript_16082/g.26316 Transcript_16082/m.26316 type:complete len:217 (-) Transcript_16082:774-1424(-)